MQRFAHSSILVSTSVRVCSTWCAPEKWHRGWGSPVSGWTPVSSRDGRGGCSPVGSSPKVGRRSTVHTRHRRMRRSMCGRGGVVTRQAFPTHTTAGSTNGSQSPRPSPLVCALRISTRISAQFLAVSWPHCHPRCSAGHGHETIASKVSAMDVWFGIANHMCGLELCARQRKLFTR